MYMVDAAIETSLASMDWTQEQLDEAKQSCIEGFCGEGTEYILINGQHVPSSGLKVVSPDEPNALTFNKGFYNESLLKPSLFVLHWDAAESSQQCYHILEKRGLSVLFMLDIDATIYQGVDPASAVCWHAGTVNRRAWGVEICNPVYLKYQNPNNPRPISTMGTRGDKTKILGFYPEQIDATVKLCHWVCENTGIPKQLPGVGGKVSNTFFAPGKNGKWDVHGFSGVCGHLHQDNIKSDPGMDLWQPLIDSGFTVVDVQ
jgi:hypothetical protein